MFCIKKKVQAEIHREVYPTITFVDPRPSHEGQAGHPTHNLEQELEQQLAQQAELEADIEQSEQEAVEREESFRGETTAVREKRETALRTELERRLGEYGYQADVARTRVGEQQSQRGMLRSTIAGRRLGDIALQEASVKTKGEFELEQEVSKGREEERRLFAKREDVAEQNKQQRLYAQLDQSISIISNLNTTIAEMKLRKDLAKEQISASNANATMGLWGNIVSTVAVIATVASCCFLFMEARYGNGVLDRVVRRYRDEKMTLRNRRGYYKLSDVLVPLMRKYKLVKFLVRLLITDPLVCYGKYYYGENKIGVIFKPVHDFWMGMFNFLGQDHEYVRETGEVV